jgi:hypothetical protein
MILTKCHAPLAVTPVVSKVMSRKIKDKTIDALIKIVTPEKSSFFSGFTIEVTISIEKNSVMQIITDAIHSKITLTVIDTKNNIALKLTTTIHMAAPTTTRRIATTKKIPIPVASPAPLPSDSASRIPTSLVVSVLVLVGMAVVPVIASIAI